MKRESVWNNIGWAFTSIGKTNTYTIRKETKELTVFGGGTKFLEWSFRSIQACKKVAQTMEDVE